MTWRVEYSGTALRQLRKLDAAQRVLLLSWIEKNLQGCENPRQYGKALVGDKKGYWRYRIGAYRLIASIHDGTVTIAIVNIAHRREVYE
jgi:mRNA interferase RelE/StbE